MKEYLIILKLDKAVLYDNLDNHVAELWKESKFKWFFPKHRKKQIAKVLLISRANEAMIKESYLK